MQVRDSFQISYSSTLKNTQLLQTQNHHPQEEQQQLSPNKRSLLETFKSSIIKPYQVQMEMLSSVTSAKKSLPCSEIKEGDEQQSKENQPSLPSVKEIKKISSKVCQQKKSKLESQRNSSQKAVLSRKITEASEFLAYGTEVEKYCFGRMKVEKGVLYFSEDLSFMGLYNIAKEKIEVISMSECIGVSQGIKTERFKVYLQDEYVLSEECCFSLIFKSRSYDFVGKSSSVRDRITNDLMFLLQCYRQNIK